MLYFDGLGHQLLDHAEQSRLFETKDEALDLRREKRCTSSQSLLFLAWISS